MGPLTVTNLPIGNYTVKVYDANWCATERQFSVTSNKITQAEGVSLEAQAEHGIVALNWVFRTNQKATNIIVERKESSLANSEILFDLLDNADANEIRYFSEKDETPLAGTAFYRVSAYLEDGTRLVSTWKEVEMPVFEEVLVYPNPASAAVHLAVNGSIDQATWIRITNQYGQLMLEQEIAAFGRFQTIDLGDMPSGMYFIQMEAEGQRPVVRRLIVETGK